MSLIYQNIGLDLDGVLTEHSKFQLEKGIPYFCHKYNLPRDKVIKDIRGIDIEEIFGCTHQERFLFWAKYIWEYCTITKPRNGAKEVTQKWLAEGRNIFIITGRKEREEFFLVSKMLMLLTKYWLNHQNIGYSEIVFCSNSSSEIEKKAICQKLNIEIMAEDRINVLNSLQETCDIVCFENMYNMGLNDKIPNFKTFYEMDEYIREIEKKKNILQKTKKLL